MTQRAYVVAATLLSAAGATFAGYLSITRMTSGVCAFAETCPFFLGEPACYTGFAIFSAALLVSLAAWVTRTGSLAPSIVNGVIGLAGVAFAGRLTLVELGAHTSYRLGLPTCAWGLVFFAALTIVSIVRIARGGTETMVKHTPASRTQ